MNNTSIVTSKANKYIHSENIKKLRDEYIKSNGVLIGSIRGPFNTQELYYSH
jgi:hypothetical protein